MDKYILLMAFDIFIGIIVIPFLWISLQIIFFSFFYSICKNTFTNKKYFVFILLVLLIGFMLYLTKYSFFTESVDYCAIGKGDVIDKCNQRIKNETIYLTILVTQIIVSIILAIVGMTKKFIINYKYKYKS